MNNNKNLIPKALMWLIVLGSNAVCLFIFSSFLGGPGGALLYISSQLAFLIARSSVNKE